MANATYKDFVKNALSAGLLEELSEDDLLMAAKDPSAGMKLLSYKTDYRSATTDEARALAQAGEEKLRSEYENNYVNNSDTLSKTLTAQLEGSFDGTEAEARWQDYRKTYLREGQLAYEDSLGSAAANTGGIASTAAVTAAQQAQNYYNAQAADKKAELYQQAYENYLAGRKQTVSELDVLDQMKSTDATIRQKAADAEAAATQQAWENENTEKQQAWENETKAAQQMWDNALEKWKAYGYVTSDIADTLQLPVGTMYSEQAYDTWYQTYQEYANGVYTGKRSTDTVNAPEKTETASSGGIASGDSAGNHSQISYGSRGSDVSTLQNYLISLGYSCGSTGADGVFGANTRKAVRAFQSSYGLSVDGICGPKTWQMLISCLS